MKASERVFWVVAGLLPLAWVICVWMIVRSSPSIPPIPPPDYPPANWDRLCVGMTQAEVASLVGKPSERRPAPRTRGSPTAGPLSLLELILVLIFKIWFFGIDGVCAMSCERWEYDGGPKVTPRPFIQFGPLPEAFVVYFANDEAVWFRRPTAGPLAEGR